jgi:hypothetical protein
MRHFRATKYEGTDLLHVVVLPDIGQVLLNEHRLLYQDPLIHII